MSEPIYDVVLRKTAAAQVADARAWYDQQRPGLGADFALHLEAAIERIARNPTHAPMVYEHVRRVLLKRFPYAIFFTIEEKHLLILSCRHTRRAPQSGQDTES